MCGRICRIFLEIKSNNDLDGMLRQQCHKARGPAPGGIPSHSPAGSWGIVLRLRLISLEMWLYSPSSAGLGVSSWLSTPTTTFYFFCFYFSSVDLNYIVDPVESLWMKLQGNTDAYFRKCLKARSIFSFLLKTMGYVFNYNKLSTTQQ